MRAHCIVNPAAGKGLSKKQWDDIWQTLLRTGYDISYQFTGGKGECFSMAKKAVDDGIELVVAVGGDGTINEIVNGIIGSKIKLAVIPTGTGNDFVRTVNIPLDPVEAAIVVGTLQTKKIDIGKVGETYFINVAGIGFDAQVAAEVNKGTKLLTGKLAYLWAIVKAIMDFKPAKIEVSYKESKEVWEVLVLALANARYYGGGMEIAPKASIEDGLLDVVMIESMSRLEFIKSLPLLLKGEHLSHPKVKVHRWQKFSLAGDSSIHVHADGELLAGLPFDVEIMPKAMEIVIPKV